MNQVLTQWNLRAKDMHVRDNIISAGWAIVSERLTSLRRFSMYETYRKWSSNIPYREMTIT